MSLFIHGSHWEGFYLDMNKNVCLSVCMCYCYKTPEINKQIFQIFMLIGPDQRKK